MFYNNQPIKQREEYKGMLKIVGSLSNLFSDSEKPMLYYRAHENIFCKYFEATNLSRKDCSADAVKGNMGIGLKTWVENDNQKVAEFGRLRPKYENKSGLDLINEIAKYRNERIDFTKRTYSLDSMIYHIVKRYPHEMRIYESAFDYIDIDHIVLDEKRGNDNNIYFSDGKHTYHFSLSKNTLYMIFDDMELVDSLKVEILEDPYEFLKSLSETNYQFPVFNENNDNKLCLRLYSINLDGAKIVPPRSGLNQWNASGRKRDQDEVYIPYPAEDRKRQPHFFPPRNESFTLILPDGKEISAKVCQGAYKALSDDVYATLSDEDKLKEDLRRQEGKAIMSNPNKALGKWLLRNVFNLSEGECVTYDQLKVFGVDSVMFTRLNDGKYRIDFCVHGTYEKIYGLNDSEADEDDLELD